MGLTIMKNTDDFFYLIDVIRHSSSSYDPITHKMTKSAETPDKIYGCVQTASKDDVQKMSLSAGGKQFGIACKLYSEALLNLGDHVLTTIGTTSAKLEVIDIDVYVGWDSSALNHYVYYLAGGRNGD